MGRQQRPFTEYDPAVRLSRTARRQVAFRLPEPTVQKLYDHVSDAEVAGEATSATETLAAVIGALAITPEQLSILLRQHRLAKVANVTGEAGQLVARLAIDYVPQGPLE